MLAIQDETAINAIDQIEQILKRAIHEKASDLHFELTEEHFRVRCRKDGLLHQLTSFKKRYAEPLITRLKVMGNLDISEHRLPQDGRFYFESNLGKMDCRVSTCPTLQGEKVVIRLLNIEQQPLALEKVGMDSGQQKLFNKAIHEPQGLILVTGPTGSGKSLTLYTALNKIHQPEKNILTIEDPIEIRLAGINQTSIQPKIGFTFARALRAFLRQDPDIIMIGEIRDEETASIAIRAAQTGHLVFSTLHTNSAIDSIQRLNNLGVNNYNIASTLNLIVSQRLVRTLCNFCKIPQGNSGKIAYQATGCSYCHQGYQGRTGIFEVIPISTELKHLLAEAPNSVIQNYVVQMGISSLQQNGLDKVKAGITSYEELNRILG